ncbi:MAG: sugar transferase [Planctomycetota bacterium]
MSTRPIPASSSDDTIGRQPELPCVAAECPPDEAVEPQYAWFFPLKAAVEFVLALVLLILAAPLILAAAVLVKLTSRGPAFYCQTRLGKDGREFTVYKLRTMVDDAEKDTGPVWADPDDSRITPLGSFLRWAHVDELPQLLNVVLGQMSLIGPRPERPEFAPKLEWEFPRYRDRLGIRPGMTGMAQLRLPADTDLESVRRKLVYDLYYVRYANPWLDFRILLLTGVRVLADVAGTLWMLVALPRWETVERHVPAVIDADADWDASENGDPCAADDDVLSARVSRQQTEPRKAR